METILNVGTRMVIPSVSLKRLVSGLSLNTEPVQQAENFSYVSSDDETLSTVSSETYTCDRHSSMMNDSEVSIHNVWIETKSKFPLRFVISNGTFPSYIPKSLNFKGNSFVIKVQRGTNVMEYSINENNVLHYWNIIEREGYDPSSFPYLRKDTFLDIYGHLLQKRLETELPKVSPDPRHNPQSKSWGLCSIFDALWEE